MRLFTDAYPALIGPTHRPACASGTGWQRDGKLRIILTHLSRKDHNPTQLHCRYNSHITIINTLQLQHEAPYNFLPFFLFFLFFFFCTHIMALPAPLGWVRSTSWTFLVRSNATNFYALLLVLPCSIANTFPCTVVPHGWNHANETSKELVWAHNLIIEPRAESPI